MSQSFKFRYDEMRENDPGRINPDTGPDLSADEFYPSYGHVRNVCFVLADGNMEALNYAYLVRHHCSLEGDLIILEFTTHTVIMKGLRLKTLFFQILLQLNKIISCTDERYNGVQDESAPVVNDIAITTN